jgi:hypothetical protein
VEGVETGSADQGSRAQAEKGWGRLAGGEMVGEARRRDGRAAGELGKENRGEGGGVAVWWGWVWRR